jgi:hypothetical protein
VIVNRRIVRNGERMSSGDHGEKKNSGAKSWNGKF